METVMRKQGLFVMSVRVDKELQDEITQYMRLFDRKHNFNVPRSIVIRTAIKRGLSVMTMDLERTDR